MRIAIFSDTFLPQTNGVATVVHQSAMALSELGHEVCVVTASKYSAEKLEKITGGSYQVINALSLPFIGYSGERLTLPVGWSLSKVKAFKPDVLHSHTPFGVGWEAVLCAKRLKVPLVGTHHTFFDHYLKHIKMDYNWSKKLSWAIFTKYFNACSLILSPSAALASALKEHGLEPRTEVIFNPADTARFFVLSPKEKNDLRKQLGWHEPTIVYMGRVSYEKSIEQVIQAFASVAKKYKQAELVIVGDGPERKKLMELSKELSINKKVKFLGALYGDDLVKALQASDFFVTASKSENMPASIIEAMACGLPTIGVDSNGMPEIVRDQQTGLLAQPDDVVGIADRMLTLITDQKLRQKLSVGASAFAKSLSRDEVARKLIIYYQQVINEKHENLSLS
ncbi:MAG: glycosyltransferase [Candidatus Falkowbacteria bacterium]